MSETSLGFADALKGHTPVPPLAVEPEKEISADPATESTQAAPAEAEATPVQEAEATAEAPEVDSEPEIETATEGDPARAGLIKAQQSERKRRQAAEAREQALKEELERVRTQQMAPQPVQQPAPEPYIDPDTQQYVVNRFAAMSEYQARQRHPDYQDKFEAYKEAIQLNPGLHAQIMASPDPGEAAYQAGRTHQFYKEYGNDPDTIMKRAEAKLLPKLKAQVEQEVLGKVRNKVNQPTNILGARAAGGETKPDFRPTGWGDVLGRKR